LIDESRLSKSPGLIELIKKGVGLKIVSKLIGPKGNRTNAKK